MAQKAFILILAAVVITNSLLIYSCIHAPQKALVQNGNNTDTGFAKTPYFLFLSDVHLDIDADTTLMGQDAGTDLWRKCKAKIKSILDSSIAPSFILYTGDMPVHYTCPIASCRLPALPGPLTVQHESSIKGVLGGFNEIVANTSIPFLYAPGNNDALVGNYYPFSDPSYPTPFSLINQPDYPYQSFHVSKTFSANGAYMIPGSNVPSGYYTVRVMKGLRVICLNTVIWGTTFRGVDSNQQKQMGDDQMAWLKSQLVEARDSSDKVYLSMHIPPGTDTYSGKTMWKKWENRKDNTCWTNTFLSLAARYESTIAGIFFGHTHYDELRMLYDSAGNYCTKVAISCPGISTEHKNNPAFKVVQFNQDNKLPTDFTTYYTTPEAGTWGDNTYNFLKVFKPASGHSIYENIKSMTRADIEKAVASIYKAKNGIDTSGNKGIYVKWEKQIEK